MTYSVVRRISLTAMSDGTLGVGVLVRIPEPACLYAGMLPKNEMHIMLSQAREMLDGLFPEEVIASVPGPDRLNCEMTNAAVVSILNAYRCDVSRIISAEDVQTIEHICGTRYERVHAEHYTVETVRRLNLAHWEAQRRDFAFGRAWSLASDAILERMKMVTEQNATLKKQVEDREVALARCEAQHVTSFN